MSDREIMNTDEAAEYLGMKVFTIREYAKKGIIPAKKIGKAWRFYKPDLVAWVRGKQLDPEKAAPGEKMTS